MMSRLCPLPALQHLRRWNVVTNNMLPRIKTISTVTRENIVSLKSSCELCLVQPNPNARILALILNQRIAVRHHPRSHVAVHYMTSTRRKFRVSAFPPELFPLSALHWRSRRPICSVDYHTLAASHAPRFHVGHEFFHAHV